MTKTQETQLRKLAKTYTRACNTGTGRQAEAAERRLEAFLEQLDK